MVILWIVGNRVRVAWTERLSPDAAIVGKGRLVPALDIRLHVVEHGAPSDPTIVLVAGTGAWAGTWRSNIAPLVAAGWHVVAIDLPPFGFSERPPKGGYGRNEQARRILSVIRGMAQPVVLLGHSYGGGPAAEAAFLDASAIRHLILVDAALSAGSGVASCSEAGLWLKALEWRSLRTALVAATGTQPLLTKSLLRSFVARKEVVTDARVAIYREPFVVRGTTAAIGDWAHQFAMGCDAARSRSLAEWSRFEPPLTLIWGARDTITPMEQAKAIHASDPRSRLIVMEGVGHIPQIEDPEAFNARLLEVLSELHP